MNCEEYVIDELKRTKEYDLALKNNLENIRLLYDSAKEDLITLLKMFGRGKNKEGEKFYRLSAWESVGDDYKILDSIYKKYIPTEENCCESENK